VTVAHAADADNRVMMRSLAPGRPASRPHPTCAADMMVVRRPCSALAYPKNAAGHTSNPSCGDSPSGLTSPGEQSSGHIPSTKRRLLRRAPPRGNQSSRPARHYALKKALYAL
jgi:hypothetical protein